MIAAVVTAGFALAALPVPHPSSGAPTDDGATATASRIKPKNGLYRGKTRQGGRVSFRVQRGNVKGASYTVYRRGCGVRITFPNVSRINRKGRFFFGRKSSSFFTGRFVRPGKVRGKAAVNFSGSSCGGSRVLDVRFRAKRVR